jgi:hypothetical protein
MPFKTYFVSLGWQVETALFAMAMQNPPGSLPSDFRAFPCNMAEVMHHLL